MLACVLQQMGLACQNCVGQQFDTAPICFQFQRHTISESLRFDFLSTRPGEKTKPASQGKRQVYFYSMQEEGGRGECVGCVAFGGGKSTEAPGPSRHAPLGVCNTTRLAFGEGAREDSTDVSVRYKTPPTCIPSSRVDDESTSSFPK